MTKNIGFKLIVSYLENLGILHTEIKQTFRWNSNEINNALPSGVALPLMLIDAPQKSESKKGTATFNNHTCAFTVIGKPGMSTAQFSAYTKQNEVITFCEEICDDITNRIEADNLVYKLKNDDRAWLYGLLVEASFEGFKVGPVFSDRLFGYRVEFVLKSKRDKTVNSDKWDDL